MTTETEVTWAARVEAWGRSGRSATEFAAGKEFSASGLRYWKSRLRRRETTVGDIRIARVVRTAPDSEVAPAETPVVVELGPARIAVRRGFDVETLAAALPPGGALRARGAHAR